MHRQTCNLNRTYIGNKLVDPLDVVGAAPVSAAPIASSLSTDYLALMDWEKATAKRDQKHFSLGIWCAIIRGWTVYSWVWFRICIDLNPQPIHELELTL